MADIPVAVFGADTHISEATWVGRQGVQGDAFWGFEQLVSKAIAHNVPLVLAGDCWELMRQPRPSSRTVQFMRSQIQRLADRSLPLYYINGQHDQLASPFWFNAIHGWPTHVGGRQFMLGNQAWYGVDFFEAVKFDEVAASLPTDVHGYVVHQQWQEFTGSAMFSPLELKNLPKVPSIVSGDFHESHIVEQLGQRFVSPGSTHMRTLAEPHTHAATLLYADGTYEFEDLLSRPVLEYFPETESDLFQSVEEHRKNAAEMRRVFLESAGQHPEETMRLIADVSTPMLLVTDDYDLGAQQLLEQALPEIHVIGRRSRAKRTIISEEALTNADEAKHVAELLLLAAVNRKLSEPMIEVIKAMLSGEGVLAAAVESANKQREEVISA